jgi:trehalose 6-phosphate synthase
MPDAVIINPYSREEVSEGLKIALSMPLVERIRRWRRLMDGVETSNVKVWRDSFVEALRASREPDLPFGDRLRERDPGSATAAFADVSPGGVRQAQFRAEWPTGPAA